MKYPELIVFGDRTHAQLAGFVRPSLRHPEDDRLRAWWPELGTDVLRGSRFSRIIVTDLFYRVAHGEGRERILRTLNLHRAPDALWLNL